MDASDLFAIADFYFYKIGDVTAPAEAYDGANVQTSSTHSFSDLQRCSEQPFEGLVLFESDERIETVDEYGYTECTRYTFCIALVAENDFGVSPGLYCSSILYNGKVCGDFNRITIHKETIKPIDEKYLPGPKLLGELVLTNENCTVIDDGNTGLTYNAELVAQIADLFAECSNHFGTIMVEASLMDMRICVTAQYTPEGSMGIANLQFFLITSASAKDIDCYMLSANYFSTSKSSFVQAVMGGYPLTIKVYAV